MSNDKVKKIPISAAKEISALGYDEVIIVGANYSTGIQHVTTYGKSTIACENAAIGGNEIKKLLKWPEEECNAKPSRSLKKTVPEINGYIKQVDTNMISDGYHTFGELYEHRIVNYIALCKFIYSYLYSSPVWMTKVHSDGSVWDGWFILGICTEPGTQITYHLPMDKWSECQSFAEVIDIAPEFDGHTSQDVLDRISKLIDAS